MIELLKLDWIVTFAIASTAGLLISTVAVIYWHLLREILILSSRCATLERKALEQQYLRSAIATLARRCAFLERQTMLAFEDLTDELQNVAEHGRGAAVASVDPSRPDDQPTFESIAGDMQ